jgi:hypothetical protein
MNGVRYGIWNFEHFVEESAHYLPHRHTLFSKSGSMVCTAEQAPRNGLASLAHFPATSYGV